MIKRYLSLSFFIFFLSWHSEELFSQFKLAFGDIKLEELSNRPYQPDPGADAIILSDIAIASLNYIEGFFVEMERDVRIRIVNSNGFDYADIEIPVPEDDKLISYRASTFNLRNGEKTETKIGKKSFIKERTVGADKVLKFNFPDVHEGSVIEYSYIIQFRGSAVISLIPWAFQADIPVMASSLTISYPESCVYKQIISGSSKMVRTRTLVSKGSSFGRVENIVTGTWSTQNMPAFRDEPYIMSKKEHLTKVSFELASINFPGSSYEEISPTYVTLTKKLLDKEDFGRALETDFKKLSGRITAGQPDNLSKLKKIHEYISTNILWNGDNDYTASATLRTILRNEKGNSADINMLLIAMLRSLNIKADPVILSTRSNGSLNQFSAMIRQFDYLVAYVSVDGEFYLVDATDPLRPFNVLPFDCLNDKGRLISEYESKFVDLKNNEKQVISSNFVLSLDSAGSISGKMKSRYSDYSALNIRKIIKLESEEGYIDLVKSGSSNVNISDFKVENKNDPYNDIITSCNIVITDGVQHAGDEIIFNPYLQVSDIKNPFISAGRNFPVDFGCPVMQSYDLTVKLPEGYSVTEKPADISLSNGGNDIKFDFKCRQNGNELVINSVLSINKTVFPLPEYAALRSFYIKMLQKQSELIVLKRNPVL